MTVLEYQDLIINKLTKDNIMPAKTGYGKGRRKPTYHREKGIKTSKAPKRRPGK